MVMMDIGFLVLGRVKRKLKIADFAVDGVIVLMEERAIDGQTVWICESVWPSSVPIVSQLHVVRE